MDITVVILAVVVALISLLFWVVYKGLKSDNAALSSQLKRCEDESSRLLQERAVLESRFDGVQERIAAQVHAYDERLALIRSSYEDRIKTMQESFDKRESVLQRERAEGEERLREQFKNLATEIMAEQSREFKHTNKESIDILLKPFKDNIADFRERVEKIYSTENEQRGALHNELRNLMELNKRITAETTNLTNALKGNSKVQGDWGEMILDTILDNSNLIRGVHYDTQLNIKDKDGNNLRPDVVLYLPDNKQIVIDSKTSLTAFVNYVSAEDELTRSQAMSAHLTSVRQHVVELGRKEYQKLLNSPDFVIMFIPNEPAFLAALQADSSIWNDAYDKKVIISSPTNLFALLKLVDDLWKRNAQSKNTEAIVTNGTKLYDQLVAFTTSLEGVGQSLDVAKAKYDDAYKRLCTGNDNIVRCGERLRKLGLPTKRNQTQKALEGNIED